MLKTPDDRTNTGQADPVVSRTERRWVLVWTLLVLFLTSIPYLVGWYTAVKTGSTFGGFVVGVDDGTSYLAKMARGARGSWLFQIVYTSEPHKGRLFYLFYTLLGKLVVLLPGGDSALPLRLVWLYHLARLFFDALLLATIYRFAAEFIPAAADRRVAWLLVVLGGGLGWLLVALRLDNWLHSTPLDFILPEGFTFLTIFTLPHIALARSLFLLGLLAWVRNTGSDGDSGWQATAVQLGGCWLFMGFIVPFYPLVGGVVIGATIVVRWIARRSFPLREAQIALLAGLIVSPVVIYSGVVFITDPIMKGWSEQNLILSPSPLHFLAAYLAPGLAALLGLYFSSRKATGKYSLLLAWALVIPPLLYIPFNLQRRLIESYQLALYPLAVIGLSTAFKGRIKMVLVTCLFVLMMPTSIMLLVGSTTAAASGRAPIYHTATEVEMAGWLERNTARDALVLSAYRTGNFLPAWAPVKSYYGHGPETIYFGSKKADVEQFYDESTPDAWRSAFLEQNGIDYFVCGPDESALGGYCGSIQTALTPVFDRSGWRLYQVTGDGR